MADAGADGEGSTSAWMNALIGAAVSVVLSFLPFSPLLGGGVAGYLQRGDTREGAVVGALSGAVATVPVALVLVLLAAVFVIVPAGADVPAGLSLFGLFFLAVLVIVGIYTVGLSTVGGVVGSYVATETDIGE